MKSKINTGLYSAAVEVDERECLNTRSGSANFQRQIKTLLDVVSGSAFGSFICNKKSGIFEFGKLLDAGILFLLLPLTLHNISTQSMHAKYSNTHPTAPTKFAIPKCINVLLFLLQSHVHVG